MGRKQREAGQEAKSKIMKKLRHLDQSDSHVGAASESSKRTMAARLSAGLLPTILPPSRGFTIHPDLFAQTNFHVALPTV